MSNQDKYHWQPVEFDERLDRTPILAWRRIVAVAAVLALIVCLNLYFLSPKAQRRVDYVFLRAQTYLKKLRPHNPYVPTPVLPAYEPQSTAMISEPTPTSTPTPTDLFTSPPIPTPNPTPLPASVQLEGFRHEPQGWNNCGPATLAMALSFYGRTEDQYAVAAATKPDKDDKNVGPEEMVAYTYSLGDMVAVIGHATDMHILKFLLSNGFPVVIETWFIPEPGDEMGHYRLLTGYDDTTRQFMTHDSYNGPRHPVSYADVEANWKVFNRIYVVVCAADRMHELTELIGKETDEETMYRNALFVALSEVATDPEDRYAWFNMGTNYVGLKQYEEAARAYDRARTLMLPWRLLWYQFGPFEAYLRTGRYQDVIDLTNANLKVTNNLEESYYYRALARRALGDEAGARQDLHKALQYNPYFGEAVEALNE